MKSFRRISQSIASLVIMAVLFPAVASATHRVVFINPGKRGEGFWENVTKGMQAAADQLGLTLDVKWAERNKVNMQILGVEEARRQDPPDFIILVNEEMAALPIVTAAEEAGVRTMFLSNALLPEEVAAYEASHGPLKFMLGSMVPNMRLAGARMGQALVEAADKAKLHANDGKLHILAIGGDEISPTSRDRNQGLVDYVATRDDVVIERYLFANWNEQEANNLTSRFLELMRRRDVKLAGIWAGNDPMAIGAIKAIEAAGQTPGVDTKVVGLNWSAEAIERIKRGHMLLTDGGHFLTGAWMMVAIKDHLSGCEFAPSGEAKALKITTSPLDGATDPKLLKLITDEDYASIDFTTFLTHSNNCGLYDFSVGSIVKALKQ